KTLGGVEYAALVRNVLTSSQRPAHLVAVVCPLGTAEAARVRDRLGAFESYGASGDLRLMDELFQLGCRFRLADARGADAENTGELRVDESVLLRTMLKGCGAPLEECRPLLDAIYGKPLHTPAETCEEKCAAPRLDGIPLALNAQQSRALRLYTADAATAPRLFCVRSPPGSGKTTVAAAMTAAVARSSSKKVQLLMSVQNVAVDNMGAALKELDWGEGEVYNMKATSRLDPRSPAPFDYFDRLDGEKTGWWRVVRQKLEERRGGGWERLEKEYDETLMRKKNEEEKKMSPSIILSTVEMVLYKLFTSSALCSSLKAVDRIIIDESSLLTEAALYCIIRRFPQARIVLIGDDKQLPPFMYDERILGHELAGRPALSVALKNGASPVICLTEVYRAPPSLVEPYNKLAYGGTLISRKREGAVPLSHLGLIPTGRPQLLFIDVKGSQERDYNTMSLYNTKESYALRCLLKKFPSGWEEHIMIICLYKEQKRRVQESIGPQYTVHTVDSSQGKEKPIVILLTTRTELTKEMGFFCCEKR
ncbi:hypothetical protein PFISCL1PPCAC_16798, partial [Pristionchus fissidentatus]